MELGTALVQHFITKGYLIVHILVVSVSVCVFYMLLGLKLNWKHVLSEQNILNLMGKLWAKITIFP